jgi:hypothetical protein
VRRSESGRDQPTPLTPQPRERGPFGDDRGKLIGENDEPAAADASWDSKIDFQNASLRHHHASRGVKNELFILLNFEHP